MGGAIPGTGLFCHEPKSRDRGPAPGGSNCKKPLHLVEQEEHKVNNQLVEILERKCAKQRSRAEEEAQKRSAAEGKLEIVSSELEDAKCRLEERDRQVAELCTAQRDLADDRLAAVRSQAALTEVTAERDETRKVLRKCQAELKTFRDGAGRTETEWKDQVLRLVAEVQSAQKRAQGLAAELGAAQDEHEQLTRNAQDVVLRYEEESTRRLELETRCLAMEEKSRSKEQRAKEDLGQAQSKAKQNLQARERAEGLSRQRDEKQQRAEERAEAAELKNRSLEAEILRLRSKIGAAGAGRSASGAPASNAPASRIPGPPRAPSVGSRPGSAASGGRPGSAASGGRPGSAAIAAGVAVAANAPGIQRMVQASLPADQHAPGMQRMVQAPLPVQQNVPGIQRLVQAPLPGSRPGTAASAANGASPMNATSAGNVGSRSPANPRASSSSVPRSSKSAGDDLAASGRLPPGAIRRAGSMPARRGVGRSPEPPPARYATRQETAASASGAGAPAAVSRAANPAAALRAPGPRPASSAGSERPCSRASSDGLAPEHFIEDVIPSEPDSSDDEVLTAPVKSNR